MLMVLGAEFAPVEVVDGVDVSSRAVDGSSYAELRFRIEADGDADALCAKAWGNGHVQKSEPYVVARQVLEQTGTMRVTHEEISPPLISRRDYVIRRERQALAGGGCRIEFKTVDDPRAPPKGDLLRIRRMTGTLEVLPDGPGKLKVEQRIHMEPGGALMPWMVEPSRRSEGVRWLKRLVGR